MEEKINLDWETLNLTRYLEFINNIIESRGQFNIQENTIYEVHHIVPRAFGGLPEKIKHTSKHDNLIWLTLSEHFEAHRLLAIDNLNCYKAVFAFMMMSTRTDGLKIQSAEDYEKIRSAFIEKDRELNTGKVSPLKGKIYPEEFRKMVSERTKAALSDPSVRKKISNSWKGRELWNKGKCATEESKAKMSAAKKGKQLSEEHKRNISLAGIGRIVTEETREKIAKAQSDVNSKNNIEIICLDNNIVYYNIKEAAKELNCSDSNIVQVCKRKRKSAGGYHFMYYDEYLKLKGDNNE